MIQISKDKADYDAVTSNHYLPVFYQPAWLNLVCGPLHWNAIVAFWGDDPVAVFPYYEVRKYGIRQLRMPTLTPYLGLYWIGDFTGLKAHSRLAAEKEICKQIVANLPDVIYKTFSFHYKIINWQPFYWEGFKQTTLYTYLLNDVEDLDRVFRDFSRNVRRNIGRAERTLEVSHITSPEEVIPIIRKAESFRHFNMNLSDSFLENLITMLNERRWGQVYAARDREDDLHSIAIQLWDKDSSYYLINANTEKAMKSGAGFLITWEAIKHNAKQSIPIFDFCGSMLEDVQDVRRQFGAIPVARSKIFRFKYRLFDLLRF